MFGCRSIRVGVAASYVAVDHDGEDARTPFVEWLPFAGSQWMVRCHRALPAARHRAHRCCEEDDPNETLSDSITVGTFEHEEKEEELTNVELPGSATSVRRAVRE